MNTYGLLKRFAGTLCLIVLIVPSTSVAEAPEAKPYSPERIPSEFGEDTPPSEPPLPIPEPECLVEGRMDWEWWYGNTSYSLGQFVKRTGEARTSACLDRMLDRVRDRCSNKGSFISFLGFGPDSRTHPHYFDDCFVQTLAIEIFPDFNGRNTKLGQQSNGAVCTARIKSDLKFCPARLGGIMGCTPCGQGRFYLNESCDVVPPDPELEVCGSLTTNYQASSPISLLWESGHDLEADATVVQFPLNPYLAGKWYQWKASSAAPLLVYDPEHTGRIDSAKQLFGEWTFGGKQLASASQSTARGGPWKNGFEALASIDADSNGVLEGQELLPLGLWFDHNRDGLSQPGEVLALNDAGVIKLFTRVDWEDPNTGSIWSYRGYERQLGDRTIYGRTVDWYGVTGNSPLDVAAKLPALSAPKAVEQESDSDERLFSNSSVGAGAADGRLSGIWKFDFDGDAAGEFPAGYLIFADHGEADGSFSGYSVVSKEFQLASRSDKNALVTMYPVDGQKEVGKDQSQRIRFVIEGTDSQIRSKALIAPDGMSMTGTSSVVNPDGGRISYRWIATRDSGRE